MRISGLSSGVLDLPRGREADRPRSPGERATERSDDRGPSDARGARDATDPRGARDPGEPSAPRDPSDGAPEPEGTLADDGARTREPRDPTSRSGDDTKPRERASNGVELTEEELRVVRELQARDREVRQHELAHLAVAGGLATSGPRYKFTVGPDGQEYATGGSVAISVSPGNSPEEALRRAAQIHAAALAPADPSGQDLAVAAAADAMARSARALLAERQLQAMEASLHPTTAPSASLRAYEPASVPAKNVSRYA